MTDYIKQVAEAVAEAVWQQSSEGFNSEYGGESFAQNVLPKLDLVSIIASVPAPDPVGIVDETDEGLFADFETPRGTLVKCGDKLYTAPVGVSASGDDVAAVMALAKQIEEAGERPIPILVKAADALRALCAAASRPVGVSVPDNGTWRAGWCDDGTDRVFIESNDFTHDVRLYVDGDFESFRQRLNYAKRLAANMPELPK